jgi:putative ABC transport system substrate-binding protein
MDGGPTEILHCTSPDFVTALRYAASLASGRDLTELDQLKRRSFITLLGGAAVAWPLTARAQQLRSVGVLIPFYSPTDREGQASIAAFLDTLQRLGWANGRNVRIESRWGEGDAERTKTAAAELVRLTPDAIVVGNAPALAELQRLTSTIPIVFMQVGDPVDAGFVASLAQPGGNVTGMQAYEPAMGGKWLGVLKEAAPNLVRVAVLFSSDGKPNISLLRAAEAVAPSLAVSIAAIDVLDSGGIERSVATFASQPDGGLIVMPNRYSVTNRGLIIILAARHRLPAIYPYRIFAAEGGLISYGFDPIDSWRGAATYVDRILRGEKPSELPVQAPIGRRRLRQFFFSTRRARCPRYRQRPC